MDVIWQSQQLSEINGKTSVEYLSSEYLGKHNGVDTAGVA